MNGLSAGGPRRGGRADGEWFDVQRGSRLGWEPCATSEGGAVRQANKRGAPPSFPTPAAQGGTADRHAHSSPGFLSLHERRPPTGAANEYPCLAQQGVGINAAVEQSIVNR